MADIYGDNGTSMNTTQVTLTGGEVCNYANLLKGVLDDFDGVMKDLTKRKMQGYMSVEAMKAYGGVKDSLYGFQEQIHAVGETIKLSAENMQATARRAGEGITANA